jgi:hypothetical protein
MFGGKIAKKSPTFDDISISTPGAGSELSKEYLLHHTMSISSDKSSARADGLALARFHGKAGEQDALTFQRAEAAVEEIEKSLKVVARFERSSLTTITRALVANTVGICDTDLFNFRLFRNPAVSLGLLEAGTIGTRLVVYSISAIRELPNLLLGRGLGVADLEHDLPERIAVISNDWAYDIGNDKTLCIEVSILHPDQLRAVAQTSVPNEIKGLAYESFIQFTMNRAYRDLDDPRRADIDSIPDRRCYSRRLSSRMYFDDLKKRLKSGSLYAVPC